MKIKVGELRRAIREVVAEAYVDTHYAALKSLAKLAAADMAAGGTPEDVYTWLVAETDLGDGQHRANAVVGLIKKSDPVAGAALAAVAAPMPPPRYVAPWSGASGRAATKMYDSDV